MSLKKIASGIFSIFPDGWLKNKIRVFVYNFFSKNEFRITKKSKNWAAIYPGFNLKFSDKIVPYHVLSTNFLFTHHFPEKPVDILVDAGSFIGSFSLYVMKRYNNIQRIIGLEPDPFNRSVLEENVQLNNLSAIQILPVGLWSKKDTLTFYSNLDIASSVYKTNKSKNEMNVAVDTLDNIFKDVKGKRIFVKMNIEGAELEALDACSETVKNNAVYFAIAADHYVGGALTFKRVEDKCLSLNLSITTFKWNHYITVYASNEVIYDNPVTDNSVK